VSSLILAVSLLGSPNFQMRMILPKPAVRADFFRSVVETQNRFLADSKIQLLNAQEQLKQIDHTTDLAKKKGYSQAVIDACQLGRADILQRIQKLEASIARSEQFLRDWNKPRPK